jgi:hypothetical protein
MNMNIIIHIQIRRTGNHRHAVSQTDKRSAQVLYVNALPAAVRIASVAQQADPQGAIRNMKMPKMPKMH